MEAANQAVEEEVKVVREELILKRRLPEMLQTLCCGSATRSAGIGQGEFFLRPTGVVCCLFVVCLLLVDCLFVAGWLFVCCWLFVCLLLVGCLFVAGCLFVVGL